MDNTVTDLNGAVRDVSWTELNNVKKDILFFFDWSMGERALFNAFVA